MAEPNNLQQIESEVMAGLPNEQKGLGDAQLNLSYYNGEGANYVPRSDDRLGKDRPRRTMLLTRRVVEVLADLYKDRPSRHLSNSPEVDSWFQGVAKDNHLDALLNECDKLSTLMDMAAIQVVATGNPDRPIKLWVWGADELVVYTDEADPTEPVAVVTVSKTDEQTTYRLYTADEVREYRTRKLGLFQTAGGRVADLVSVDPNPYNTLPFVFFHYERPTRTFHTAGIGSVVREAHAALDLLLNDADAWVRAYGRPEMVAYNTPADWGPVSRVGDILQIPGVSTAIGDTGPKVEILQPGLDIPGVWHHLTNSLDQVLTDLGVPLSVYRGDAQSTRSGISLLVEQSSLLVRQKRRQLLYEEYEHELAELILYIGGRRYGRADLLAASIDPQLSLEWPEPRVPVPSPEIQAQDLSDLDVGALSLLQLVQRRLGCSREGAIAHIRRVAEDRAVAAQILGSDPPSQSLKLAQGAANGSLGQLTDTALANIAADNSTI